MTRMMTAAAFVFFAGACASNSPNSPTGACTASNATATSHVDIQGVAYVPSCFKVAAGTVVTFTNQDSFTHTVTSDSGQTDKFDSVDILAGKSYQHTFNNAGNTTGHCNYHSNMHFTAVVQ